MAARAPGYIKGDSGEKGDPGTGGAGSPGMVWRSTWTIGQTYTAPTDGVCSNA